MEKQAKKIYRQCARCEGWRDDNVAAHVKRLSERTSEYIQFPQSKPTYHNTMIFVFNHHLAYVPVHVCMDIYAHWTIAMMFPFFSHQRDRNDAKIYILNFYVAVVAFKMGYPFYRKKGIWCFLTYISKKLHNMQTHSLSSMNSMWNTVDMVNQREMSSEKREKL